MKKEKTTVRKTVNYRRCIVSPKPGQSLQQLVGAAITTVPRPSDRYETINGASNEFRCIGVSKTLNGCLCGFLTTFQRGAAQPVIGDDPRAARLRLEALPPPKATKGGVQQQYVPGVVYFAIHENHVAVVQSAAIRDRALENHLAWLLRERSNHLADTSSFALSDEAQKATKAKIKRSHIKSIGLGQPLMSSVVDHAPEVPANGKASKRNIQKKTQTRFRPQGPVVDFLRSYFTDDSQFEKLGLDDLFDGNLDVWIEIRYPKRSRVQPEDSMRLMDKLGVALRDIEGDQVDLELADGSRVKGSELKISALIDFPVLAHNLPDEDPLWEEMSRWLLAQIANGVVDP